MTVPTRKLMETGRKFFPYRCALIQARTETVQLRFQRDPGERVPELSILNRKHTSETRRLSPPIFQSLPCLPRLKHSTKKAHFARIPTGPKEQHSG